jgi:predicted GIY-YIG superfamily endonuclease
LTLIYEQEIGDRSLASKIEIRVKRLPKTDKENNAVLSARIRDFVGQCQAPAK